MTEETITVTGNTLEEVLAKIPEEMRGAVRAEMTARSAAAEKYSKGVTDGLRDSLAKEPDFVDADLREFDELREIVQAIAHNAFVAGCGFQARHMFSKIAASREFARLPPDTLPN